MSTDVTASEKRCPRCGNTYPRDDVHFARAGKQGLAGYCRTCSREVVRAYRRSEKGRDWLAANRKRANEHARRYRATEKGRAWRVRTDAKLKADPAHRKAMGVVSQAVLRHRLLKPKICMACDEVIRENRRMFSLITKQTRPLEDLYWFCASCHKLQSRLLKARGYVAITLPDWAAVHEDNVERLGREADARELRLAACGDAWSIAREKRRMFLAQFYDRGEVTRRMSNEGWERGRRAPLECVLGHWVPAVPA